GWVQGAARSGGAAERPRGVLFMPYRAGQIAALRSTISAWMRLAIFEAMNREEGGEQPRWFVIDELDALGQIDGLKDALARLRKFGGRCVLGFQSIAQVSSTYGSGEAQTIVENCGNTLVLRCSGSEHGGTSQFASRLIGEREVVRVTRSRSRRALEVLPAITHSEHLGIEAAVMGSEIEQLPDLAGYLKLASSPAWLRVGLQPAAAARGRRLLPSHAEVAAVRATRSELSSNVALLIQQGGRVELRHCGAARRLCVHVDRGAPTYGEASDYLVVKGYCAGRNDGLDDEPVEGFGAARGRVAACGRSRAAPRILRRAQA